MNVEKVKEGINKLKDMIKPEGVIDIKYTLEPIEKNEFYMSVKYIVPDDSPYLRIHSMSQNDIFRQDLNRELKTNIDAYMNVRVIITSSGITSESYYEEREGHSRRQNESIEKIKGLLK